MAFVLVQHLDPTHTSALTTIVGNFTRMPVQLAADGMRVEPNQVYVIPPDAVLTIADQVLHVARPATVAARRNTIDVFLSALAEDLGEYAVGVILSGFGSDGALGVAAIKEWGGLTLSQAEFDHHAQSGMPQSATAGGLVDHVLLPRNMPEALLAYQSHRTGGETEGAQLAAQLPTICAILKSQLDRDFTRYKQGTLTRRIQRRMNVLRLDEPARYADLLRKDPREAELLFRELLIGVTRFFRDPAVFEELGAVIKGLLLDESAVEPLRVWVAGCASGEEAYSIAILLLEAMAGKSQPQPIQVFGTDLDDRGIGIARAGLYPAAIAADVSPDRLARFFIEEPGGQFRVRKELRGMCLFSMHDLVSDPPFSRLDLISCRNLLIYFDAELQSRVLGTFHYALRPGRTLLLGPSESVSTQSRLFMPVDKKNRIYARRDTAARLPLYVPPRPAAERQPAQTSRSKAEDLDIERRATRALATYAPRFLVVNRAQEVQQFSGNMAGLLQPVPGQASLHLFALLHPDLHTPVRSTLRAATDTGVAARQDNLLISINGQQTATGVVVEPLAGAAEAELFVIAFLDQGARPASSAAAAGGGSSPVEAELQATRERLHIALEDLEAANEELRSSNEEYLTVNEELQSTNEELETSQEELQSLNEELQMINAELNHRNDTLVRANSDLVNLFDSTSVATLFLDNELRIRRFTPRLCEIFALRDGDEGRPITDIVTHLSQAGLGGDVRTVIRTLSPVEREVIVPERGTSYLMQVRPYRDINNVVDGAVVTFMDISERKREEEARSRLATIVESSQDAIFSQDRDGNVTSWNAGAAELFGYAAAEIVGRSAEILLPEDMAHDMAVVMGGLVNGERIARRDTQRRTKDGRLVDVSITWSALLTAEGTIHGVSVIARDIRLRREAEGRAELLMGELNHRVKNVLTVVSILVMQSARANDTIAAFSDELQGRLRAMANAHDLVGGAMLSAVPLAAMVSMELAPYQNAGPSITITGPAVLLTAQAALAMSMAIHELATNAAKYGSLSTPAGSLTVEWSLAATPSPGDDAAVPRTLTMIWTEAGGPEVTPPARRGFGSTLIERVLAHDNQATVDREFRPSGIRCTIVLPIDPQLHSVH